MDQGGSKDDNTTRPARVDAELLDRVRLAAEIIAEETDLDAPSVDELVLAVERAVSEDTFPSGLGYNGDRVASAALHQAKIWRDHPGHFTPWTDADGSRALWEAAGWSLDEVRQRLDLYDNHNRHRPFWTWWEEGVLTSEVARAIALEVWCSVPTSEIPAPEWVTVFRSCGFVAADATTLQPQESVSLWRGASLERWRGISWSSTRKVAEFFAWRVPRTECAPVGYLLRATVEPTDVLAYTNDRAEDEWLVDPAQLELDRSVEIVRTFDGSEPSPRGERRTVADFLRKQSPPASPPTV